MSFLKLHNKFFDNPIWKEKREFSKAECWIDILRSVRYSEEPEKVIFGNTVVICKQGESLNSLSTWADKWGMTVSKTRRILKLFVSEKMISTEEIKRKTTKLTVLKYRYYRDLPTSKRIQSESKTATEEDSIDREDSINIMSDIISLFKKSNLPAIRSFTDKRKKHLKARINESKEFQTIEFWEKFVDIINNSDFLSNRIENKGKHKNWKADIDFVLRQDIFNKILEGKYNNSQNNDVSSIENQMKLLEEMGIE